MFAGAADIVPGTRWNPNLANPQRQRAATDLKWSRRAQCRHVMNMGNVSQLYKLSKMQRSSIAACLVVLKRSVQAYASARLTGKTVRSMFASRSRKEKASHAVRTFGRSIADRPGVQIAG